MTCSMILLELDHGRARLPRKGWSLPEAALDPLKLKSIFSILFR